MTSSGKTQRIVLLLLLAVVDFYHFYIYLLVDLISLVYWLFCIITVIRHTNTLKNLVKDFREKITVILRVGDGEK